MNPFSGSGPSIEISPAMLFGMENKPSLDCELPYDTNVVAEIKKNLLDALVTFRQDIRALPNSIRENPALVSLIEGADVAVEILQRAHNLPGAMGGVLQQHIEAVAGAVPESQDVPEFFEHLRGLLHAVTTYNEVLVSRKIKIVVVGDSDDLDALQTDLQDELIDVVDDFRRELADKYGWSRGQTTCCPRMGYNPPESAHAAPVHDPEEFSGSGQIPEALRMALARFLGGAQ